VIVKVLSIKQPWSWLIVNAKKDVENRTWRTHYRGPLYIHAGQGLDLLPYFVLGIKLPSPDSLQRGGIIGKVELIDCTAHSKSKWAEPGLIHLVLANPQPVPFFKCRGQLGIFNVELPEC
jgi:hypothetical protein